MKKPCSEMFCLRNQDITDAKAFFIYFLCRTQVKLNIDKRYLTGNSKNRWFYMKEGRRITESMLSQ